MSSLFALRALLFVGECLLASSLLMASAWLASRVLAQASLRHFIWLTAFGAMLVLPLAAIVVPPRVVVERAAAAPVAVPSYVESVGAAALAVVPDPAPAPAPRAFELRDLALGLFAIWLAGFSWVGLRLVAGALGLRAMRRKSRPHALASADLPNLATGARECELRLSASRDGPITWGFARPVILLPNDARSWSRPRLQAVLLHELAHVRRRDCLTQSLSLLVCALYWPNPLVWLGARALRREAEIAADDAVIESGVTPSSYAGELLALARELRGRRTALSGVAMAGQSSLEERVESVLDQHRTRTGVTPMNAVKIACLGLLATSLLAFARPDVVAAQDSVPPPPVPAVAVTPATPATPTNVETPAEVTTPADVEAPAAAADDEAPNTVRVIRIKKIKKGAHGGHFSQAQIDAIEREAAQAQVEAQAEIANIQPKIEQALAAAKVDARVAQAMATVQQRVQAEIARAMAKAKPELRKALADARISERVALALKKAQPAIDAALARADKDMDQSVRVEDQADQDDDRSDDKDSDSPQ